MILNSPAFPKLFVSPTKVIFDGNFGNKLLTLISASSLTINRLVEIVIFPASAEFEVLDTSALLALSVTDLPTNSTSSEAFTVKLPAFPVAKINCELSLPRL